MRRSLTVFLVAFSLVMLLPVLSSLGTGAVRVLDELPTHLVFAVGMATLATLVLEMLVHLWRPSKTRGASQQSGGSE